MLARVELREGTELSRPMMKVVLPEKWYLVVDCAGCGEHIPFAEANPPIERSESIRCGTIANLTCPHCGHVGTYVPTLISLRPASELDGSQ